MSDFKNNLNEEIEKRSSEKTVSKTKKLPKIKNKTNISIKHFLLGMGICSIIMIILVGWAWLSSDKTNITLLKKLPSKTAIVNSEDSPTSVQTTLKIPKEANSHDNVETSAHDDEDKNAHNANNDETIETSANDHKKIAQLPYGSLPEINKNTGAKPYKTYQSSFTKKTDKPLLSFVITEIGLSAKKTENIILNLPAEISLSFSPYSKNLDLLTSTARKDGHEVWLSLPLETKNYPLNDPGPSTLLVNASTEKNQARLHSILASTQGYVGFISQPDHVFKAEDANINPAIKEIFERGLAIIDGNMSLRSFIDTLANKHDYPYAQNNLWLDNNLSPLSLNQNIRKITNYSEQNKNVIVMLNPYPASIKTVQKFLNSKEVDKFELAPVSAQLKNN